MSLQLLGRSVAPGSDAAHALDIAEHQVQKLARLVNELLDVARIRQGKTDLRMERVDLTAVAAAAVETVRPLLDERLHTFEALLPPAPACLNGDAVRLEQVFTNLLTNAAKYTEPGGRISLRVDREGGHMAVRVRDTGVGLVPDLLPRIFEPFARAEQNLHRARGGLGLGLSLVKHFVELHGGTVEARSDGPGRGSEFIVRLPALPESAPERAAASSETRAAGLPVSVLVVDDNRDAAESLAQLTRLWGCEAATAYDGPAAVAAAGARPPDVVFMDLSLPEMDGYETARRTVHVALKKPLSAPAGGADRLRRRQRAGAHGKGGLRFAYGQAGGSAGGEGTDRASRLQNVGQVSNQPFLTSFVGVTRRHGFDSYSRGGFSPGRERHARPRAGSYSSRYRRGKPRGRPSVGAWSGFCRSG